MARHNYSDSSGNTHLHTGNITYGTTGHISSVPNNIFVSESGHSASIDFQELAALLDFVQTDPELSERFKQYKFMKKLSD